MGLVENPGHVFIRIRNPFFSRHHKNDDIRLLHGNFRLVLDLGHKGGIHIIDTTRINDGKLAVKPVGRRINPVAGHAFDIFDNRDTLSSNPVK